MNTKGLTELNIHHQTELPADCVAAAFAQALAVARDYEGSTTPNPAVGCVLLDSSGEVLVAEAHQKAGQGHAEARAIVAARAAGLESQIHTAVVTLEPCNHHGRTGPCTQALLSTPVRSVWIGTEDPNPDVAGGGAKVLADAGLDVRFIRDLLVPEAVKLETDARRLIAPFAKRMLSGKPFVTVKQALDMQGSMVPPAGQKTFTSDASLDLAHRLRRRADAILTGSGTILADNPLFTVRRVADFPHKKRLLVILDRRGRVPQTYLDRAEAAGFAVRVEADLLTALHSLGALGVMEVLVEAGPLLTGAVLAAGLWDEHITITHRGNPDGTDRVEIKSSTESAN